MFQRKNFGKKTFRQNVQYFGQFGQIKKKKNFINENKRGLRKLKI